MKKSSLPSQAGFTLMEVVMALAIMSFCLIVLLGILPLSLTTIQNASEETRGINVISNVVSDLRSTPAGVTSSPNYQLTIPAAGATGSQSETLYVDETGSKLASATSAGVRYKVTITLSSPTSQNTINGEAKVSWPPQAPIPTATVETYFALDRS